jgi:hypothetical protein
MAARRSAAEQQPAPACLAPRPHCRRRRPPPTSCLQEYLNDYASPEVKALGEEVIKRESEVGLSDSAQAMLQRKLKKVNQGEHDLYI